MGVSLICTFLFEKHASKAAFRSRILSSAAKCFPLLVIRPCREPSLVEGLPKRWTVHLAWIFHCLHSERKQNDGILLTVPNEMAFKLSFCFSSGEPNSFVLCVSDWKKKHPVIGLRCSEDKDRRTRLGLICLAPSPAVQPAVQKESSRSSSSVSLHSGFPQLLQKS